MKSVAALSLALDDRGVRAEHRITLLQGEAIAGCRSYEVKIFGRDGAT
jgi:hypothetical protein